MRADFLNPGRLRHQITWERRSVSGQNAIGEDIFAWVGVSVVRAEVKSLAGRELESARQMWAEARYKITHQYVPGLTPADRISWYVDGKVKTLDVLDVQDASGQQRYQVVIAKDHVE